MLSMKKNLVLVAIIAGLSNAFGASVNCNPQNGVLPIGVTNETALFLNSGKSFEEIQRECALENYNRNQAAMKARQEADINAKYEYRRNQIDYETKIRKKSIEDKYAKKALERQREKLRNQYNRGLK